MTNPTTVAEAMTEEVVTAEPGETLATVAERMRDQRVGSVVVVDGDHPVGILTERDLVRATAAGAVPETTTVDDWMTADPDCVAPDVDAVDRVRQPRRARLPPHPGGRRRRARRHRLDARPHAHRADPAGREPRGHEMPARARGRRRRRDRRSATSAASRASTTTASTRAVELAEQPHARGRLVPDVRRRAARRRPSAPRSPPRSRRCARPPDGGRGRCCPTIAGAGAAPPLDVLRTALSLLGAARGLPAVARHRRRPSCARTRCRLRGRRRRCSPRCTGCGTGLEPIEPATRPRLRGQLPLHDRPARCPTPEHARAVEQYLISTIDHGFNASTFTARVITSTGADLGAAVVGAHRRAVGPAARRRARAGRSTCSTRSARPTAPSRGCATRSSAATGIMGFGHAVYKTDDPRSVMLRGVAEQLGGEQVEFAEQVEATVDRGARRAQARPRAATPTSSSTPAS